MADKKNWFNVMLDPPIPLAGVLAVFLAAAQIAVDWATWVDLDVSALYSLPVVLAAVARNRRLLWGLALSLLFMTFAVYAVQIEPGAFSFREPYFINRVLSAVTLMLTAFVVHAWIVAVEALATQSRAVKVQNQELERLRQVAEEANGRKTRLLASVAHDIRTPLSVIDMTAKLMRSAGDAAPASEVLAGRLLRNTNALANLVSALVDISSLDAGRMPLHNSVFSLNELLAEESERLLPLAQAKNLRIASKAPEPPLSLRTDRIKLSRILSNLVSNAIKFTESGGITVSAVLTSERAVLIDVKDTGVGMTPESLGRIFDEYGQLGNPERDSNRGWGLGLAICRRLVDVMDGAISVESAPNRGTVFTVRLPASCVVDG